MTIAELIEKQQEHLRTSSEADGTVLSSAISLSRNAAGFAFTPRLTSAENREVELKLLEIIRQTRFGASATQFPFIDISQLEMKMLREAQLIRPEMFSGNHPSSILFAPDGQIAIMLLEEDHLRFQNCRLGFCLPELWKELNTLDDAVESRLIYAWNSTYGYLTASPTNLGTGMRISVLVHLPALIRTRQYPKLFNSLQKVSLTVRGLFGEGARAWGDLFLIVNQVTLGPSEDDILAQMQDVVSQVVQYEIQARTFLFEEKSAELHEMVNHSMEIVRTSPTLSLEEAMTCLSCIRLGASLGILQIPMSTVNHLIRLIQPGHLNWIYGGVESSLNEGEFRAEFLQKHLKG